MPDFVQHVEIDAPVSVVFAFHEREDALALLSPPFPPVRVVRRHGGIAPGARVELIVAGVWRWIALHTECEPPRLFVDRQLAGPFRHWTHRHEFEALGRRTRLTDRISWELPGGALVNAALAPLVKAGLTQMFRYRHRVTRQYCEGPQP